MYVCAIWEAFDDSLFCAQAFRWHKNIFENRETVEDEFPIWRASV